MIVRIDSSDALQLLCKEHRASGRRVGFVPTMGALHDGHLSLVARAREESDVVVVSIFVNPLQFGPGEDHDRYPRDLQRDQQLLDRVGADVLFHTNADAMYPNGYDTYVVQERTSAGLCGASRPGHFRGVLTVVLKLFNLVAPHRAYFGEKDYQQLIVIQRMVRDLALDLEVVGCPIVREPSGLALSSRNVYLSESESVVALGLQRSLKAAQDSLASGVDGGAKLEATIRVELARAGVERTDYVAVVDAESLAPVERVIEPARALVAAWLGSTRLIDNMPLIPSAL